MAEIDSNAEARSRRVFSFFSIQQYSYKAKRGLSKTKLYGVVWDFEWGYFLYLGDLSWSGFFIKYYEQITIFYERSGS